MITIIAITEPITERTKYIVSLFFSLPKHHFTNRKTLKITTIMHVIGIH
ncbi:hypothetical protein lbkm_1765 [Lachnospiraceae bacterium KM106-2]|nr:hypothetical protein lbkm_1765 [Lachnospiraceae bacterium KM106-2]